MRNYIEYTYERCLKFKYYSDDKAKQLEETLREKNIDFVAYYDGLYILFKVRKPKGYTWNDMYAIINAIKPARYFFENTCIKDGQEYFVL